MTDVYDKHILLTGGAGFIGSHVAILLAKKYPNYKIVNFDKLDYCSSLKNLESISKLPNYTFIKGCITSTDLVTYVLRAEKIDTIMHFAAQSHVDNSFGNSIMFTETNILGTHVLLEAAKQAKIKLFIHVSTDEVYGDGDSGIPSAENTILEPTNPYAATKAGAEYLVKAYYRSFNLPVIITRGNNVYGPHQFPEKIIPKFVNQIMRGLPLTMHGSGLNTRNYLHVSDVANAFDKILHEGVVGSIYNIGGKNEVSNVRVAYDVLRAFDRIPEETDLSDSNLREAIQNFVIFGEDRPFNDLRYPLDCAKLFELGWEELVSWEEGIKHTVDWFLKHSNNWDNIEFALSAHPQRGLDATVQFGTSSLEPIRNNPRSRF